MAVKTRRPKGKRDAHVKSECRWCGCTFLATRGDKRTCTDKCRWRLAKYVRELGWMPDKPPGDMSGEQAVRIVILTLIRREKEARQLNARAEQYRRQALGANSLMTDAVPPKPKPKIRASKRLARWARSQAKIISRRSSSEQ